MTDYELTDESEKWLDDNTRLLEFMTYVFKNIERLNDKERVLLRRLAKRGVIPNMMVFTDYKRWKKK